MHLPVQGWTNPLRRRMQVCVAMCRQLPWCGRSASARPPHLQSIHRTCPCQLAHRLPEWPMDVHAVTSLSG